MRSCQKGLKSLGELLSLSRCSEAYSWHGLIEAVIGITGEDVYVQVPDVLPSVGFVVLAGRDARAPIRSTHCPGNFLHQVHHRM